MLTGAVQGYFAGRTDLLFQRFMEIWGSMPELYLLIIFASIFDPSIGLLLLLLSLFGWMGLSDYVRADFLRNRNLEYVQAARALGLSNRQIIWRHILPNSLTPVVTFLPFRMSAAILALTSLDFLGLGVPPSTPSLGELLAQGKNNLDAWWIALSTFMVLTRDAAAVDQCRRCLAQLAGCTEKVMSLLDIQNLQVAFGEATVVDDVSFSIAPGEKFALVGESGSGKTVTALSVLRLNQDARYGGRILFEGHDILQKPERALRQLRGKDVAMIFQEPMTALNPLFTIGNQIAEVLMLHEGLIGEGGGAAHGAAAGQDRHTGAGAARAGLSAPALRRPAPARHDRDGAGLPAASC